MTSEERQNAIASVLTRLDRILAQLTLGDQLTLSQRISKLEDELRTSRGK